MDFQKSVSAPNIPVICDILQTNRVTPQLNAKVLSKDLPQFDC